MSRVVPIPEEFVEAEVTGLWQSRPLIVNGPDWEGQSRFDIILGTMGEGIVVMDVQQDTERRVLLAMPAQMVQELIYDLDEAMKIAQTEGGN